MTLSESDPLFLGIDGGGTSTVAWLGTTGSRILGRCTAGPSNAKAVGETNAREALTQAIAGAFADARLAFRRVESACFGLAGFGRVEDRQLLARWADEAGWAQRHALVTDGDLVVAAGTPDGWGIGVIAGTGSIALGRSADGRTARAGGWGHLIGDEGSGYQVVLNALRMVARRADGREPRPAGSDLLTTRLCAALGAEIPSKIVSAIYAPGMDRSSIAALAPVVVALSAEDPEIGPTLLQPAGRELGEQVVAVARALGFLPGALPLAVAGGFLLAAWEVITALVSYVELAGYQPITTRVEEPVRGALILAERRRHG
jgi:N-acetylglucosamine kinase-like BadF-type ATPase